MRQPNPKKGDKMAYRLKTESAHDYDYTALILPLVKAKLRILSTNDDVYLTSIIKTSIALCEKWSNTVIAGRSFVYEYSAIQPSEINHENMVLPITKTPVVEDFSVCSLKIKDGDDYVVTGRLERLQQFAEYVLSDVELIDSNDVADSMYPVTLEYKAGYYYDAEIEAWAAPILIQQAVADMAVYMYENPTDCGACGCGNGQKSYGINLPSNVSSAMSAYKVEVYNGSMYF